MSRRTYRGDAVDRLIRIKQDAIELHGARVIGPKNYPLIKRSEALQIMDQIRDSLTAADLLALVSRDERLADDLLELTQELKDPAIPWTDAELRAFWDTVDRVSIFAASWTPRASVWTLIWESVKEAIEELPGRVKRAVTPGLPGWVLPVAIGGAVLIIAAMVARK